MTQLLPILVQSELRLDPLVARGFISPTDGSPALGVLKCRLDPRGAYFVSPLVARGLDGAVMAPEMIGPDAAHAIAAISMRQSAYDLTRDALSEELQTSLFLATELGKLLIRRMDAFEVLVFPDFTVLLAQSARDDFRSVALLEAELSASGRHRGIPGGIPEIDGLVPRLAALWQQGGSAPARFAVLQLHASKPHATAHERLARIASLRNQVERLKRIAQVHGYELHDPVFAKDAPRWS